mmetsp:Transcript_83720/g.260110  ORF Transcript_83720/g.260110 Transcript_83720/m.260110 type:complete len:539 (+) Transcript_83720:634-2250(+)
MRERVMRQNEVSRHGAEKIRRMLAWHRESRFRDRLVDLNKAISKVLWGERYRDKAEHLRNRNEAYRGVESNKFAHVLRTETGVAARGEAMRGLAEDARRQAESWRNRMVRSDHAEVQGAIMNGQRIDEQAKHNENYREKNALANIMQMQRVGDRVSHAEKWRKLAELIRIKRELVMQRAADEEDKALAAEMRRAQAEEERRLLTEQDRQRLWKSILSKVLRTGRLAGYEDGQARKREETREQQEARRARETDDQLKRLKAGEDQVRGDQAGFDRMMGRHAVGEKRRIVELNTAIGQLTDGEHWFKGLEVSRWHHEMKREEQERWRREHQELYKKYISKLTGKGAHDRKVHRWYLIKRAKIERKRLIRMKYLRGEALTAAEAAINDEASRERNARARESKDDAAFRAEQRERAIVRRELKQLESLEMEGRTAEKQRIKAEYRREDEEERRVREIVKAAMRPGPPGPLGSSGPAGQEPQQEQEQVTVDVGGRSCDNDPYCGRRRRSHAATIAANAPPSTVAIVAPSRANSPVVISTAQTL